jgi:hypothetical protein
LVRARVTAATSAASSGSSGGCIVVFDNTRAAKRLLHPHGSSAPAARTARQRPHDGLIDRPRPAIARSHQAEHLDLLAIATSKPMAPVDPSTNDSRMKLRCR